MLAQALFGRTKLEWTWIFLSSLEVQKEGIADEPSNDCENCDGLPLRSSLQHDRIWSWQKMRDFGNQFDGCFHSLQVSMRDGSSFEICLSAGVFSLVRQIG